MKQNRSQQVCCPFDCQLETSFCQYMTTLVQKKDISKKRQKNAKTENKGCILKQ